MAVGEVGDGGYAAVVVREVAVGGWHEGAGCPPARGLAHRQVVHDGARSPGSPGCRNIHPLLWSPLLHLCLPSAVGADDVVCHGGPAEGQQGEDPGLGKVLEKSGEEQELGLRVCLVPPQEVWA